MTEAGRESYWRSLERLERLAADQGEFPDDAELKAQGMARRRMLQLMGASFALAGLASCRRPEETIVPFVRAPEGYVPGAVRRFATTMPLGRASFGAVVESREGRPIKIEGNGLHPASRGAASAWMQAAILDLYDPDRLAGVLARGEGAFEPSSWEDFAEAWRSLAPALERKRGRGLAVLTTPFASPALARLAGLFRERFPEAAWVAYEPLGDENLHRGMELLTGRPLQPIYHLDRARRVLSLDADFLLKETGALTWARDFAASRRDPDEMGRLYVVESTLTLTGANADHRIALSSRDITDFTRRLAKRILKPDLELAPLPDAIAEAADAIAADLESFPERALIVAGRSQPPEVHAIALAMNEALGAFGSTLTLASLSDEARESTPALTRLAGEMARGEIETLAILGGNPVYDAPADLDLASGVSRVGHVIHLSTHANETSRLAHWLLPEAHFLEAWGDARSLDGTPSLIQPLVHPLHGGKSVLEVLSVFVQDAMSDGFGLVRDAWIPGILGEDDVERKWGRALHDGVYAEATSSETVAIDRARMKEATRSLGRPTERPDGLVGIELAFTLSSSVHDGRFANNGWLQELPDPVTKLTWDNAALVSPRTAAELGLKAGDVVTLSLEGRSLDAPVLVLPGQADRAIALALGYGRTSAGRVGDGVGANANAIRTSGSPFVATGVRLTRTGRRHALAITQEHGSMEGRDLVRESPSHDSHDRKHSEPPLPLWPLWTPPAATGEHQWGMAIDLSSCQGCNACITACQAENNIPLVGKEQVLRGREMHWLRVDRYFAGEPENPRVVFQLVPCMHCENAPCEQVCPVGATVHDSEGLNAMVYNRCIGTRYCSNNCPYKVRRFNFFNYTKELPEIVSMAMNPDVTVRSRGVMEKCTYCVQRIHEVKRSAKLEGRTLADGEVKTACQETCPAEAITFGDVSDPESRVSALKASGRNYVLLEELHHRPRTSYLTKVRNPNPSWRLDG
jgi:molybdopterin-containing oxidoreductase family iron-sulfur binding subunit